jgi:hypothetical protein
MCAGLKVKLGRYQGGILALNGAYALHFEPIDLGSAVFARHRNARCINDVSLDALRGEPTR